MSELALVWQHPELLWLAMLPLLIPITRQMRRRRLQAAVERDGLMVQLAWQLGPLSAGPGGGRGRGLGDVSTLLRLLAWTLLVVAAAGPAQRMPLETAELSADLGLPPTPDPLSSEAWKGRAVLLLVEASADMRSGSPEQPSSLLQARQFIEATADRWRGASVGLTAYGANAAVLQSLSWDPEVIRAGASLLDDSLVQQGGSNLAHGLALLIHQVRLEQVDSGLPPLMVWITDTTGEEPQDKTLGAVEGIAATLAEAGVRLLVLQAPSPALALGSGFATATGSELESAPAGAQAQAVRALEVLTPRVMPLGGLESTWADVEAFVSEAATPGGQMQTLRPTERLETRHELPLAVGLMLWLLGSRRLADWLRLPSRRRGVLAGAAVWVVLMSAPLPQAEAADRDAWTALQRGDWEAALRVYGKQTGPRTAESLWGRGLALLKIGRAREARMAWEEGWLMASDPVTRRALLYHLGHAHAAEGNWQAAADAWREVLRQAPDHAQAEESLREAIKQLERQQAGDGETQDLYGRQGRTVQGKADPTGGETPEMPADDLQGQQMGGDTPGELAARPFEEDPESSGSQKTATRPTEADLQSGRAKVERLQESQRRLREGLVRQDQGIQPVMRSTR